ncbi:M23 family metallopeptidase [Moraxella sp.]|uniref:M23 family metallopeptidase n=1 Tax=Moraxella sp. TaxID=479 RepID=UPI0026DD09C6|nr:M23 family metallopeptidase [Moraxella sp.]MDO4895214.1 M23 family metallopeptidase [Moraxella sp.]
MNNQPKTTLWKVWIQPALAMGAAAVMLVGCASKPTYNSTANKNGVTTRQIITNNKGVPNWYQVKQGDTVAKIAQRYGLDWREIGRLNNLNSNYTIYTGQWLSLWKGNAQNAQPAKSSTAVQAPTQQGKNTQPAPTQKSGNTAPVHNSTQSTPFTTGSAGVMQFKYPVGKSNPVVRRFGTANVQGSTVTSNGMWFSGQDGDPILASRAGTVINADGNSVNDATITIQHTDGFISSYIYIKDAKVRAGDSVQAGQQIASMKKQTSNSALFEFRIARNNVYIDPLSVVK